MQPSFESKDSKDWSLTGSGPKLQPVNPVGIFVSLSKFPKPMVLHIRGEAGFR